MRHAQLVLSGPVEPSSIVHAIHTLVDILELADLLFKSIASGRSWIGNEVNLRIIILICTILCVIKSLHNLRRLGDLAVLINVGVLVYVDAVLCVVGLHRAFLACILVLCQHYQGMELLPLLKDVLLETE